MITIKHAPIKSVISAVSYAGLAITTPDGRPAKLAIIDENGHVIESGEDVAAAAWNTAILSHQKFLVGMGHMRIHTSPPGAFTPPQF